MKKTSKVKNNNHKRTKLSRQGKLKHKRHKKAAVKSSQPIKPVRDEEEGEEMVESDHGDDMLDMVDKDDLAFLQQAVQGTSYSMLEGIKKKKRKLEDASENLEMNYEKMLQLIM